MRSKRKPKRKQESYVQTQVSGGLPAIEQHAAGIDIGSQEHWVCAPLPDGSGREIANFGGKTPELIRMVDWLNQHQVKSVALESTGVYWIAPFEMLEAAKFEVRLVDTRKLASVPGRDQKSDPNDCQWIQRLHSCGLLAGAFRPAEEVCKLRTLIRDKLTLVEEASDWLRRMQKSLDQMNVRVHRAVSDLNGETGMAIVRAILKGEKDPQKLAKLRDRRCHKSEQEIAEELTGNWREDHIFSLRIAVKMYDEIQERIQECEQEILKYLEKMAKPDRKGQPVPPVKNPEKGKTMRKRGQEEMREALYRMSGVDLTDIDGIGVETIQVVLTEYGPDLSRFPTEKQFVKHATLAPHVPKSGGKPLKKKRKPGTASSRVAAALRMAASAVGKTETALGAYYRQISRRKDGKVAIFATARKLATIIYRYLRWGKPYVDIGAEEYEKQYQKRRIASFTAKAQALGYQLIPISVQD